MKMRVKKGLVPVHRTGGPSIVQDMCDLGGTIINLSPYYGPKPYGFIDENGTGWMPEWLEPVEDEKPSFESEIARLIEAYPDKADELKKLMPEMPIVPDDWKLIHPNGLVIMEASEQYPNNRLYLFEGNFDFEIIRDFSTYLKVTPI